MYEELKIVDYGKDYGFGRYTINSDFLGKSLHTDDFNDVIKVVNEFHLYCQRILENKE